MTEVETVKHDEIEIIEHPNGNGTHNLFGTSDPDLVIEHAAKSAKALAKVVHDLELYKVIGKKAHVFVEAWTLLGSMFGVFAVEESAAEPVEIDGIKGFKATVSAVTRDGAVVGRATSYCMADEPNWKGKPVYALAAMAQTRATSRALRAPLGFIMKLAGYDHTPAEEVRDAGDIGGTLPLPKEDDQRFEAPSGKRGAAK